jgi:hypothetical protein
MRNIVLSVFGLFILINFYAQDYIPILADSNTWYTLQMGEGYSTDIIKTVGDTVIGDKKYIITKGTGYYYYEDTLEKKVFIRDPDSEKEIRIYDFSLQPGDTIILQRLDWPPMDYSECIVDSVRPFQLNGIESRAIYLTSEPINWGKIEHPVWIEGVGSLGNHVYTAFGPDVENLGELACYYKNGELLYQSSLSKKLGDCNYNDPGGVNSKGFPEIGIYPNPFTDQLTIEGLPLAEVIIEIFDMFGREIYHDVTYSVNSHTITTNEINPGIYLIRVSKTGSGTIVINNIIIKR